MDAKTLELPYRISIPREVLSDKTLQHGARLHYGLITALAKKEGYCWATDEQLADAWQVSVKTIEKWNRSLQKAGHIRRETESKQYKEKERQDGKKCRWLWKKRRRIYVCDKDLENSFDPLKKEGIDESLKKEGINDSLQKEGYKDEILKDKSLSKKKDHALFSKASRKQGSPKIERALHVHTTDEEHARLAGPPYDEHMREKAYQVLSDWKEDTQKSKWKKSDYRSIRRWVFDAVKEKEQKGVYGRSRANPNLSDEKQAAYDELF